MAARSELPPGNAGLTALTCIPPPTRSGWAAGWSVVVRAASFTRYELSRNARQIDSAQSFTDGPYDLVTSFDCLHDMGDPVGAARHIRQMLSPDGTWMIVEPSAGDNVTDRRDAPSGTWPALMTGG